MPSDAFAIVTAYTSITLSHVMTAVGSWLERSIHVGPLRSHCDPNALWSHEDLEDQDCSKYGDWYDGTKAWYTLAGQQSGNLVKRVNVWMQNRFRFRLLAESMRETLRRELQSQLTVSLSDIDLNAILSSMNRNSTLGVITLCTEDGVTVTSRDVGVGYSQLLPVVTAAFIAERKSNLNGIRIFEQPELHIHAKLQATLADLLIQQSDTFELEDYNVPQFLLETHSEYLLLRLMRRIRETKKGMNPAGPRLSAEDVVLHRVWMEDGATRVSEMPLDEFGNLTVEWPDNLLEISYRETFGK
jgi:predicted ATPase